MAPRGPKPPDRRADLFISLEERIRNADAKSPAELAALAKEVEEKLQDLDDVEPEIRDMLLRRQRVMVSKDAAIPPRTPEPVQPEKPAPVLRQCCCGCGAMLVCGSGADAAMTELCKRDLADPSPPPPVDASAQRAYCEQLSRPRKLPNVAKSEEVTPTAASRLRPLNYGRLQEMAKPRELPAPPPPEPAFRAAPAPTFKPPKSPRTLKPSRSAPDLRIPSPPGSSSGSRSTLGLRARDSLRQLSACAPSFDGAAAGANGGIMELRCHALKSKCFALPPCSSLPRLPSLGQDFSDELSSQELPEKKRHVSATYQRRYTEEHLYRKPTSSVPGSVADLQAKLDALKKENKARDRECQAEERTREKSLKRRNKHSHRTDVAMMIAGEIC